MNLYQKPGRSGALKANDRAKLRMSVLQAAVAHARDPHGAPPDLSAECGGTGIDAVATRALVAGARTNGGGLIEAPGLAKTCSEPTSMSA
jgi:hypothetical protein